MTTIQTRISFHAQTSVHQIRPRKSQARRRMPGSSPLLMRVAPEVGRLAATPASRAGEPQRGRQLVGDLPELLSVERVPNGDVDAPEFVGADRKSTRLNSRHGHISYAAFCLTYDISL